ncbi:MAG: hypothetical protein ACRD2O_13500 [Terriglobia bacterium]
MNETELLTCPLNAGNGMPGAVDVTEMHENSDQQSGESSLALRY